MVLMKMEHIHGSQVDPEFYLMKKRLSNIVLLLKVAIIIGRISNLRLSYSLIHSMPLVSLSTS